MQRTLGVPHAGSHKSITMRLLTWLRGCTVHVPPPESAANLNQDAQLSTRVLTVKHLVALPQPYLHPIPAANEAGADRPSPLYTSLVKRCTLGLKVVASDAASDEALHTRASEVADAAAAFLADAPSANNCTAAFLCVDVVAFTGCLHILAAGITVGEAPIGGVVDAIAPLLPEGVEITHTQVRAQLPARPSLDSSHLCQCSAIATVPARRQEGSHRGASVVTGLH